MYYLRRKARTFTKRLRLIVTRDKRMAMIAERSSK